MSYLMKLPDAPYVPAACPAAGVAEPTGLYRRHGKRLLDLVLVLGFAPLMLMIVGVLALLVRCDGGPAFFAQTRVGRGGRSFRCWKLRTMVVNADEMLTAVLASDTNAAQEWIARQKLRRDPRITRLGRFLRQTSLDELPQLWNVVKGEMSLIGPRPFTPDQRALYSQAQPEASYYTMRPGLTGAWQVGPRAESAFAERATFDSAYARKLCLWLDLVILVKTVRVVLAARGS